MPHEEFQFEGNRICKWTVGRSTFIAMPEQAGRLMNWHVQMADSSVRDVIAWPDNADYQNVGSVQGGMVTHFPFCGQCFADGEPGFWKWKGHRWPMPENGFARSMPFEVVAMEDDGFTAQLTSSEATAEYYPYDFVLRLRYRFREMVLEAEQTLENTGKRPIPWSPGFLPYLQIPWLAETTAEDYRVEINANKAWQIGNDGTLGSPISFKKVSKANNLALDGRIHTHLEKSEARVYAEDHKRDAITLKIGGELIPQEDLAVTTYLPPDGQQWIAMQPSMGPANAPGNERGLGTISSRQSATFALAIKLY